MIEDAAKLIYMISNAVLTTVERLACRGNNHEKNNYSHPPIYCASREKDKMHG